MEYGASKYPRAGNATLVLKVGFFLVDLVTPSSALPSIPQCFCHSTISYNPLALPLRFPKGGFASLGGTTEYYRSEITSAFPQKWCI